MKPQTAFIAISIILLLAVLWLTIYVANNKKKTTMTALNNAQDMIMIPNPRRVY